MFQLALKRKRCGTCEGCTAKDCGKCRFCLDKPRFGGRGVLKQCCVQRKCKRMKSFPKSKPCTRDLRCFITKQEISDCSDSSTDESSSPEYSLSIGECIRCAIDV